MPPAFATGSSASSAAGAERLEPQVEAAVAAVPRDGPRLERPHDGHAQAGRADVLPRVARRGVAAAGARGDRLVAGVQHDERVRALAAVAEPGESVESYLRAPSSWQDPFNELYIRTWRDLARYRGSEALGQEGPQALMRLPWLMEEILDAWDITKKRPQFKAEYMITHNIVGVAGSGGARRRDAARHVRRRDRERWSQHYLGFTLPADGRRREAGAAVPVRASPRTAATTAPEVYREVIIPMFAGDGRRRRGPHVTALRRRRAYLHQAGAGAAGRHRAGRRRVLS